MLTGLNIRHVGSSNAQVLSNQFGTLDLAPIFEWQAGVTLSWEIFSGGSTLAYGEALLQPGTNIVAFAGNGAPAEVDGWSGWGTETVGVSRVRALDGFDRFRFPGAASSELADRPTMTKACVPTLMISTRRIESVWR